VAYHVGVAWSGIDPAPQSLHRAARTAADAGSWSQEPRLPPVRRPRPAQPGDGPVAPRVSGSAPGGAGRPSPWVEADAQPAHRAGRAGQPVAAGYAGWGPASDSRVRAVPWRWSPRG